MVASGASCVRRAVLALLGCLGACAATRQVTPPLDYVARRVVELERFEIRYQGEPVGTLLHLEIEDAAGPIRLWRVDNRSGAWLGFATEQGRFSRRVPFRDDDEDLGVWPMKGGIAQLIGRPDAAIELRPTAVAAPATTTRRP